MKMSQAFQSQRERERERERESEREKEREREALQPPPRAGDEGSGGFKRDTVEQIRHAQDSQGQILALVFERKQTPVLRCVALPAWLHGVAPKKNAG